MANEYNRNLFSRLTKLFRSGPVVRRRVKGMNQKTGTASTALEVFRAAHSDVYNSTLSAYGAFDRMCVSLDTKIPVPGPEKYLTMGELIERYSDGEKFIVYAYDAEKGEITPAWAHHPRSSGVRKTVRVTFDDGSHLICTPDHPCMMRDGTFRDAGELSPGDSMMSFCHKDIQDNDYAVKSHRVISVEPWETIETGDLTVDGYENFATDTIIVHNSRYGDFCLVGDTYVAINHPDTCKKISDIVEDYQRGTLDYGVFSMHNGEVRHGIIENAWCTGEREIWEVELDNGNVIQCTDNHPFMLRNGEYCRADQLVAGAALMPYKRLKTQHGYLFTPSKDRLAYEHCLVVEHHENYRFEKSDGLHIHHRNFVPADNRYENLCTMPAAEHLALHARINNKRFEIKENRDFMSTVMKKRWSEEGDLKKNHEKHLQKRKKSEGYKKNVELIVQRNKNNPPGVGNAGRKDQRGIWNANANKQWVLQSIYSAYVPGMDIEQLALKLDAPSPRHIINRLKWGGYETWESFVTSYSNHKVAAVRKTDRVEKVYDITVKDYHNFALTDCRGNGTVFVHNSEMESCIAGDTLIATPDGYIEIQELAKRYGSDETFIVYSYDHEKKQIVPALGKQARKTVTDMSLKVTFDSGKVLVATPDHRVMRRDGTYCEVQDLKPGDSMMPFYRRDLFAGKEGGETSGGYRWIYAMDREGSTVKNGWVAEHRLIAEWVAGRKVGPDEVVHHINFKKWDNRPENLQIMLAEDHRNYHAKIINGKKWDEGNSKWIEDFKKKHSEFMKLNNPAKRHDISFANILQVCDRDGFNLYSVSRALDCSFTLIFNRLKENGFNSFETFAKAYDPSWRNNGWDNRGEKNPRFDPTLTFQNICDAFNGQSIKSLARDMGTTPAKITNRIKSAGYATWSDFRENFTNHKVVSVEPHGVIDLYDLTVDGYKNYATDSIIVHNTPEISAGLDIYAEETVSQGTDGRILHIHSDNRKIQELLESLFYDTVNIEFNLVMWVRNLVKYGDFFMFLDVSPDYGVLNCIPISISEIEREEGFDPSDPMAVRYRWITQGNRILENWQVIHFRLLGNDAFLPYGSSVLEGARRIWRQLILIEDAMLVYRVIRAPERRVFYIDVGNVPPEEIPNYLEQAQSSLKRNEIVDKSTGKVDLRFNPMAVDQDYFLPVRGGESGTKIDTLAGGQNTAAIEDVQYIQKKLFAALKIPKAYLGYDEETGCFTGDTRVSLLDGREVEIERLASEHAEGKQNWVYSFDTDGNPHVGKILNAWETKRANELCVVSLDNGEEIRCTGNHRFMMGDGTYVRADELEPGMSCMTFCKESKTSVKSHKVLSAWAIVLEEPVPVYDLEVEKWSNFSLSAGVVVHNSKATLAQEDIRFSRSIQRIQKTVLAELNKMAMIHLYSHGYEGEDLMDFTLKLSNPSSIAQQQKLELISTKFDIAGKAPEGLVSRRWIRKNILELTDQEIEALKNEREDDKLEDAAVESAGAEEESESGAEVAGEEGGEEGGTEELGGLFAGDRPAGELLTAMPGDGDREDGEEESGDEEEEEFVPPSIDDLDAPVKLSNRIERAGKKLNMFGEPIKKSRKQTRGPASTGMHDFAQMTGLGNTQSTLRDPYQKNWLRNPLGVGEGTGRPGDVGDAMRTLASLKKSNKFASPKILKETGAKSPEDDVVLDIDLNSLKSEFEE